MWYIDTIKYYSVVKSNGVLKFAGKWMKLEKNHTEWGNPDTER